MASDLSCSAVLSSVVTGECTAHLEGVCVWAVGGGRVGVHPETRFIMDPFGGGSQPQESNSLQDSSLVVPVEGPDVQLQEDHQQESN